MLCSAPDGRAYFLLLRQKKVAKEKATPRRRSFGMKLQRSALRCSTGRAAAELAFGSDSPRRHPPARLRCSAASRGLRSKPRVNETVGGNTPLGLFCFVMPCAAPSNTPRVLPAGRGGWGGKGRGLSEPAGRVPQPPPQPSSAGHPEGAPNRARLLFGYFFLARQEKVCPPVRGGIQRIRSNKTTKADQTPYRAVCYDAPNTAAKPTDTPC